MSNDFVAAKRGWIAITIKTKRTTCMFAPSKWMQEITVGVIENVSRAGDVKGVKPCGDGSYIMKPRDWQEVKILDPGMLSDPAGFLAECRDRQTPAAKFRPWEDIADVAATARAYR